MLARSHPVDPGSGMHDPERSDIARAAPNRSDASSMKSSEDLREAAIKRLKKRGEFRSHLVVYLLVNAFLWGIWAVGDGGFPWPVFVTSGWGVGLLLDAWETYRRRPVTDQDVQIEMRRLEGHR